MKKSTLWVLIILGIGIVIAFSIVLYRSLPAMQSRPPETRAGNVVFAPDTLPKEYSRLFDAQQLTHITVSSISYDEGDFPVCLLSFMDQYDIIIFKKKTDTIHFQLSKFLTVERPLSTRFINDRIYSATDGYINFKWATERTTTSINNLLMTISEKGKLRQEIADETQMGYIIDDWQKVNFFYGEHKNPELIFEMNALLFGKSTAAIGLLLKKVENGVCLIFLLPKDEDSPPVSKELLKTLM